MKIRRPCDRAKLGRSASISGKLFRDLRPHVECVIPRGWAEVFRPPLNVQGKAYILWLLILAQVPL
jgi:hypothetical protein